MPRFALPLLLLAAPLAAAPPDFDRAVAPVLTACLDCHSGADAKGKLDLTRAKSAGKAIEPGKPAESAIWQRVSANEMPPKKPLSDAEKKTLKEWIESGAKWGTDPIDPLGYTTGTRAGRDWWAFTPVKRPEIPANPNRKGGGGAVHPIDAFVLAKLADSGLSPSPPADKRTLLRRLKFDLLGLPPTPEELDAFVKDDAKDAYEKRVNEYLASRQYGERWARHWLDVVRFAESSGFETNLTRPNAWPYRDWVIKALNDDMPYTQFVTEQIAGDSAGTGFLVAGAWDAVKSPDPVLTATQRADELHDMVSSVGGTFLGLTVGCARCHTHKFDPVSQTDYYRIKAAFSGVQHGERELKGGDASERAKRADKLRGELADAEASLAKLEPLADPASTTLRRGPVRPQGNTERFAPVIAKFVRFVVFATSNLEPCIDELEIFSGKENVALASAGAKATSAGDYPGSDIHKLEHLIDGRYGNSRSWISNTTGKGRVTVELPKAVEVDRIAWARDREGKFLDRTATRYRIDVSTDGKAWQVVASSDDRQAMSEAPPGPPPGLSKAEQAEWAKASAQADAVRAKLSAVVKGSVAYAGRFTTPEVVHRLNRGDPMDKREAVGPGVLAGVGPKLDIPEKATDAERRAAVAKWLTDPAHPLTARVIVNRLWQQHFGTGLVNTPSDFGFNGGRPSHPELLDWLASELMSPSWRAGGVSPLLPPKEQGADAPRSPTPAWSLKHLHRLIVTSAIYRQSSASSDAGLKADAGNRLLWRFSPRRLEAEAIRDSILAMSGKLDLTPGGPGFDLFEPNGNYVKVYTPKATFGPAEFRRMVYQQKPRMQPDDTFGGFDCPDAGQPAPKRNSSTTPLQALNLLNSPFVTGQAEFFAARLKGEAKEPAEQVRRAFRLAFGREPSDKELSAAEKVAKEHGLAAVCRALLNANEFLYVD